MNYRYLFTPITIGSLTVKNRICMVAMHHLYTEDGLPTDRFSEYYYKRAEGGTGLIIVGSCRFEDYGSKAHTMSLRTDACIAPWKTFTDGMHARGAAVAVQLYHAGRYMPKKDSPAGRALSPSATFCGFTHEQADEMTEDEIRSAVSLWAEGALRAKKAGFDAVEISGSVGYLISQFLSPLTNLRTDEYGGSWENRCRFPLDVIRAVRNAVGTDYPVILRMSGSDLVEGSLREADLIDFAKKAEAAGIDALDITGGWHETTVPQLLGDDPQGGLLFLAQGIKNAVSVPVIGGMRINRPEKAEELLAVGMCDMVSFGRPLIADPALPAKAAAGQEPCIRTCVACNQGCLSRTFFDRPIECFANGLAGRETEYDSETPAQKTKNILVIGGGVAGMEAAVRAAHRGHAVTLTEQSHRLGGLLSLAAKIPARYEFANLISYYEAALDAEGVTLLLGKTVSAEDCSGFDEVIVATGAVLPPLPYSGTDSVHVITVSDLLSGKETAGKHAVILGGNFIGCETARYLLRSASMSPEQLYFFSVNHITDPDTVRQMLHSSCRTVTLIEPHEKIAIGYERGTAWPTLNENKRLGIRQYKSSSVQKIGNGALTVLTPEGEVSLPCDTLIVNANRAPSLALSEEIAALGIPVHTVGDALRPSTAMYAIRDAAALGCSI